MGRGGGGGLDNHNVSNVKIDTCMITSRLSIDPLEHDLTLG